MPQPTGAGSLRDLVSFQARAEDENGDALGDWTPVIQRLPACLSPSRGGEQVIAMRQAGVTPHDLWVRYSARALAITTDMRVVDARDERRVFAIKAGPLDMDRKRKWLLFQLQEGPTDA